ncbi:MAG: hypothetical protein ABH857_01470 [Elusimicrobiota bacterium]
MDTEIVENDAQQMLIPVQDIPIKKAKPSEEKTKIIQKQAIEKPNTHKKQIKERKADYVPVKEKKAKEKTENSSIKMPERRRLIAPVRQTYHIEKELVEKVKIYAYIERMKISEVVNLALKDYLKDKKLSI